MRRRWATSPFLADGFPCGPMRYRFTRRGAERAARRMQRFSDRLPLPGVTWKVTHVVDGRRRVWRAPDDPR